MCSLGSDSAGLLRLAAFEPAKGVDTEEAVNPAGGPEADGTVVADPSFAVPVDGAGVGRLVEAASGIIQGVEVVDGINPDAID